MSLCECKCGGEASPGKRFIKGHNLRVNIHPTKGKTKETDEGIRIAAEKHSKNRKEFYASEEGQKYIEAHSGKNNHMYGKKGPMYGKHHTEEAKQKNREAHTGKNNSMYGKHVPDSVKQKISASLLGKSHTKKRNQKNREAQLGKKLSEETKQKMRETHSTKEGKQKMREARMHRKFPKHHTKPEIRCEYYNIKNNIPATYTGNGSFWIPQRNNGNKVCNPDFILYANGKKFVIEIFGDYWHSPLLNHNVLDTHYKDKKRHYKRYGWIPIFIWELDIMRPDGEKFFLSELKKAGAI